MGKPSKGTPADKRLAANNTNTASSNSTTAPPKFGSPAWDAKYGIKRKFKKAGAAALNTAAANKK